MVVKDRRLQGRFEFICQAQYGQQLGVGFRMVEFVFCEGIVQFIEFWFGQVLIQIVLEGFYIYFYLSDSQEGMFDSIVFGFCKFYFEILYVICKIDF